jgi:hypothetical protein
VIRFSKLTEVSAFKKDCTTEPYKASLDDKVDYIFKLEISNRRNISEGTGYSREEFLTTGEKSKRMLDG